MKKAPGRSLWSLLVLVLVLAVAAAQQWWARHVQQGVGEKIAARAGPHDIQMLSSDTCAPCVSARAWLHAQHVPFNECSIERDAACRQLFETNRSPGTPLLLVRGQPQLGFSLERVLQRLAQPG